jgi:hypothetical protein
MAPKKKLNPQNKNSVIGFMAATSLVSRRAFKRKRVIEIIDRGKKISIDPKDPDVIESCAQLGIERSYLKKK